MSGPAARAHSFPGRLCRVLAPTLTLARAARTHAQKRSRGRLLRALLGRELLRGEVDGGRAGGGRAELRLGDARAHRGGGRRAARGERHLRVHELGARPPLVLEDGRLGAALLALDHLDVRAHPALGVLLDEVVRHQPVGVELWRFLSPC